MTKSIKSKACIVNGCMNVGTRNFPKDETRLTQWVKAITHKKPGLILGKSSTICVAHFRPSDFIWASWSSLKGTTRKHLNKDAIPSVFPWNESSQETPSESHDVSIDSEKIATRDSPSEFTSNESMIAKNTFDPTKVQRTYARTLFALVEEKPAISKMETASMNGDPLQPNNVIISGSDECNHNILKDMKPSIDIEDLKPNEFILGC